MQCVNRFFTTLRCAQNDISEIREGSMGCAVVRLPVLFIFKKILKFLLFFCL